MNDISSLKRKCSAALAAGAGAAVCLTGGGPAQAAFVSGPIAVTNGGQTVWAAGDTMWAFGHQASWGFWVSGGGRIGFSWAAGSGSLNGTVPGTGVMIAAHSAGVTISAGMANGFADHLKVPSNVVNEYFAVRFKAGGTRYGWLRAVSSNAGGTSVTIDRWGYDNAGGTCKTLSDSVTTQKLSLSDGRVKLHWSNANEDGVARYQVQTQDALGAWHPTGSETPGEGRYAAVVPQDAVCRLVVEKVDGTAEEIGF